MKRARSEVEREISPPPLRNKKRLAENVQDEIRSTDKAIKVYSWNVNGVGPLIQRPITSFFASSSTKQSNVPSSIRTFLERHQWPQVVCLQEVKIKRTDEATKRALDSAVNGGEDPRYVVRICLPRDKHNAIGFGGKIYGVATLIREDFWQTVISCHEVDWDLEGRILVLETRSKLAIINIYAVNGTDAPYRDPVTGEQAGTRHERKLQFHTELKEEVERLQNDGFDVVLAGDMNIARSKIDAHPYLRTSHQHVTNRADFNERFVTGGLRLIDSFRHLHDDCNKFTYFPRGKEWGSGCDRVDLILISRSLEDRLLKADMFDTSAERGTSDHVPLYIALGER